MISGDFCEKMASSGRSRVNIVSGLLSAFLGPLPVGKDPPQLWFPQDYEGVDCSVYLY